MIKQKTIKIGEEDFIINSFPATKGLKLLKQITKLVGPAFSELIKGGAEGTDINPVSLAMEKLFDNLDAVDVETLVKELVSSASKGSISINFDMEFSGDYVKLFNLVKEIVEFNFGSVFTLLGSEAEVVL
jgi:hypothetical protein